MNVKICLSRRSSCMRSGITLVELMIAIGISLIILLVMVRAFRVASSQMTQGRATIEMAGQLRAAGETLRIDLQNLTVPLRPMTPDSTADGYFEYIEGPDTDAWEVVGGASQLVANNMMVPAIAASSYLGDHDDILAMTVRSDGQPFRGRWVNPVTGNTDIVESYVAEVIWWVKHEDIDPDGAAGPSLPDGEVQYSENLTLHRRVLLVRPDLNTAATDFNLYYANNDVSVRPARDGTTGMVMNSLADLTRRENRFTHNGNIATGFPHEILRGVLANRQLVGDSQGEDVVLTSLSAFDVKVFSPNAEIQQAAQQVITPSDPGFDRDYTTNGTVTLFEGAYVDLGYNLLNVPFTSTAWFSGLPNGKSQLDTVVASTGFTWCTWSPHYEYDGIDQDGDGVADAGTDGIDNNGTNGTDDDFERETKPPYPYPIRSLQVTFRMIEKGTGQSRQLTVRESFVPE